MKWVWSRAWLVAVVASVGLPAGASAQDTAQSLGSVTIGHRVLANGQPLGPGAYTLRVVPDPVTPAVGQTASESRWVEFVRGGKVVGREMAIVIAGAKAKAAVTGPAPAAGSSRTELLKGNEYLRVWVHRGGTHYLIHLAVQKAS